MRRTAGLVLGVIGALASGGCASQPEYQLPVGWGGQLEAQVEQYEGPDQGAVKNTESAIYLYPDGAAWVSDMPQGEARDREVEPFSCLEQSTSDPYTGQAQWSAPDSYNIVLRYLGTELTVSSSHGRFGTQDWGGVGFYTCDPDSRRWSLGVACGDAGRGLEVDCPTALEIGINPDFDPVTPSVAPEPKPTPTLERLRR